MLLYFQADYPYNLILNVVILFYGLILSMVCVSNKYKIVLINVRN